MQVWPYLVVLTVASVLFQPLCNRIVRHALVRLVPAISRAPQPTRILWSALIANVLATNAACIVLKPLVLDDNRSRMLAKRRRQLRPTRDPHRYRRQGLRRLDVVAFQQHADVLADRMWACRRQTWRKRLRSRSTLNNELIFLLGPIGSTSGAGEQRRRHVETIALAALNLFRPFSQSIMLTPFWAPPASAARALR
jgi:hypothetical protein